ncbi:hypothetical protein BLOT_011453 [Blomia tropicalis]|nr:hypothetical protein BLOT_011453 [Blomia tropicalis]
MMKMWKMMKTFKCCYDAVRLVLIIIFITISLSSTVNGQCPWPRTPHHASLHSDCVCGYSNVRRLSVQCSPVANFSQLLEVLHSPSVQRLPIDLLYVNNATGLSLLPRNAFKQLDIQQIHLANTRLDTIERGAFAGLENKLLSLTLQGTGLREVPVGEFRFLRSLRTLDLSHNRIRRIRADTFGDLERLATLRLASNHDLQLDRNAFLGLERTLKNLNLKAIGARFVPDAIRNLTELAFLDLAQNKIDDIVPRVFENLHSLTALSLERNLIHSLHPNTFVGLNDSLSSLSLLNNLLTDFPQKALSKLAGIRVLDLGFNAIRQLPSNAFKNNYLLTLLALDGNPLKTAPLEVFQHLNSTLRGISIGGKAFECDCKVRWLSEWAMEYNLQITSRERNPQFCAKPMHLRTKPFTHIDLNDFVCDPLPPPPPPPPQPPTIPLSESLEPEFNGPIFESDLPISSSTSSTTSTTTTTTETPLPVTSTTSTTTTMEPTNTTSTTNKPPSNNTGTSYVQVLPMDTHSRNFPTKPITVTSSVEFGSSNTESINKVEDQPPQSTIIDQISTNTSTSSSIVVLPKISNQSRNRSSNITLTRTNHHQQGSIRMIDAIYRNNSIWIRWELTNKSSNMGYQIVYRYFGSKEFHKSENIPSKQTQYTLTHNIAPNELIVVCVIDLADHTTGNTKWEPNESAIPITQCRELNTRETIIKKSLNRTPSSTIMTGSNSTTRNNTTSLASLLPAFKRLNDIDKIVIAISIAVCIFIIVAVLVFSCCFYRSVSPESPLRTVLAASNAKCLSTKSLSPITKSSLDHHDWETVSVYSTRSIPRARIGHPHPTYTLHPHHEIPPPPTISGTIRSHISSGIPHHHPQYYHPHQTTAPIARYFGSTLPAKSLNRTPCLDSYLNHHYTSGNQIPVVTYGTTVTANGGAPYRDHYRSSNEIVTINQQRQHHSRKTRPKTRSKNRSTSIPVNVVTDLRLNGDGSGSGNSYNRLLLSSSSNSFQSQNEYDSDNNNLNNNNNNNNNNSWNNGEMINSTTTTMGQTGSSSMMSTNPRLSGGGNSSRMNDNEVDIYVDQNYVRRFI